MYEYDYTLFLKFFKLYLSSMKSLLILGRQPELALAELESLLDSKVIKPIIPNGALVDVATNDIEFTRIGGSIKLASVLNVLDTTDWREIDKYLHKMVPEHLQYVPDGKFRLGISTYGLRVNARAIQATALSLKKIIKAEGRSVRIVPNKTPALNSAQVLHNNLFNDTGWELVFYRNGNQTILALTKAEQDIEAFSRRDQNRPYRDAKVGMLPPKLAQIIINLATPPTGSKQAPTVLDPFCGTGVVLQEALLMGMNVYGTDIEQRMIDFTRGNLDWLSKTFHLLHGATEYTEVGDATQHQWSKAFTSVACETYLGKPLSRIPTPELLSKIMSECDNIHSRFLKNIATQIKSGTRLCLAVPAWKTKNGFKHLKTLDNLKELGYTRIDFVHAKRQDLIYHRSDQFVARELVVLQKV